ncbi:MAG: cytochrome ubiquinol oxidase subunit I [Deltaproteobacteria bacterium]|nr:cytochrome ubiquinol oxidase subunit I [Deltaproteobacteria bacterium]MCB9788601.1 cytochrome ubiquinol oxidase subunit I [Deltaproteobacteria bacterium]
MIAATPADVLFARSQMATSLGFHIIFASVGIAMPLLMVLAEAIWLRTGDPGYRDLARRWAKGTAVFFAVGAVSGTVLSFELGLLFPEFMARAGAIIGMPFSLEGFAFFTEAIFLGICLYGWERVRPAAHLAASAMVALSGALSALFVTLANAWMNAPTGFRLDASGAMVDIDPLAAMASPFALHEVVHTLLAAYMATAFAVAAIHALGLLRDSASAFHRRALTLALALAIPAALAQPLVGHYAGQQIATLQPAKLAALEQLETTQAGAPLTLGPLSIPGGLSLLAFNDPDAVVTGLDAFAPEDRPPAIVRPAFLVMVGLGTLAALYALVTAALWWRRRALPLSRPWLLTTLALGPAGFLALEAGWVVTEVGRQPWTIYGILRTRDAVTAVAPLWIPFVTFTLVYIGLAIVVLAVLRRQVRAAALEEAPR